MKENRERSKYYDRDLLFTDFTGEGGGDKPWNRFQLRNTGYIDYFVIFFDPRGRYGRFYGVMARYRSDHLNIIKKTEKPQGLKKEKIL